MPTRVCWRALCMLVLAGLAFGGGCRSLGREVNEALPEFLRFDPGKEELERYRRRIQVLNRTPAEKAAALAQWEEAKAIYDEGRWPDATDAIEEFLESFPDTDQDKEARLLLIRAYRNRNKSEESLRAIKSFIANYPISEYNDDVEAITYDLAIEYLEGKHDFFVFSSRAKGVELLELLVLNFPAGKLADQSQWELGKYQMGEELWIEAGEAFQQIIDRYPDSRWIARATYNRALCRLATVKGADYDEVTIIFAMEDFQDYLDRFPEGDRRDEAVEHIDFLEEVHGEKQLRIARWYRGQGFDQSARFYLLKTIQNHPDTKAAAEAEKLIAEIPADYEDPFDAPEYQPAPEKVPDGPAPLEAPEGAAPEETPEAEAPAEPEGNQAP